MSEEILINISQHETRVGIVENGILQEVLVERTQNHGIVGNVYKGKVARVLPGMQAAFIDMGLDKAAFLHMDDMLIAADDCLEVDESSEAISEQGMGPSSELSNEPKKCISEYLQPGQEIIVQVIKDPLGTKGARLTTRVALSSRFLVFMPELSRVGISTRIEDPEERDRLRNTMERLAKDKGGYIVRTAAEGAAEDILTSNMQYLTKQWKKMEQNVLKAKVGELVYEDLTLSIRALQDFLSQKTDKVRIDDRNAFKMAVGFVDTFIPDMRSKLEYYQEERPLFDLYGVEDEIQKALQRKVQLKSGGHLVFDQTEAMTTIDVNTGGFVGHRNLEETIFKTNLEASLVIARQLRLRNLGGIIIIDFIDMIDEEHKRQVLRALEKSLAKDHTKHTISEVSSLGLVEMTRKRSRESLEHILCETCTVCKGRGVLKTTETICYEIFREIIRAERAYSPKSYLVLASQRVVDKILEEEASSLAHLESSIEKSIKFQVDNLYHQEQFDVVLM